MREFCETPFALLLLTNHKIPEGVKCNGSTYCHEFPISTALEAIASYINPTNSDGKVFSNNELFACLPGNSLNADGGLCLWFQNAIVSGKAGAQAKLLAQLL